MKTYYKATRPDGKDFYSGTIDYAAHLESGKPLKRITSSDGKYECCSSTVYHASDVPSETLIGGRWPCRLFGVTGRPVTQEGHKFGFRSLRVVHEIPAWRALGPNGEKVSALIERIQILTSDEINQFNSAWRAARHAAWGVARHAARHAARDAAWDAARDAAWDAGHRRVGRGAAWDAAWGAAAALTVGDLVGTAFTQEHFDLLYGPWREVIGDV